MASARIHPLPAAGRQARRLLAVAGSLATSLSLAVASTSVALAASPALTRLGTDPYNDTFSFHRTVVEPDIYSYGSTIVSAFQVSRVFNGGAANVGWATSQNGGATWRRGDLPATTINASPPGVNGRVSDTSVVYNARDHMWLLEYLLVPSTTSNKVVNVFVSRSTDGVHWQYPVAIAKLHQFLDKPWITCDNSAKSPFYGNCYTEFEDPSLGDLIYMSTSTDGGLTWSPVQPTAGHAHGLGGQPVVQPDGTVIVPINVFSNLGETISAYESTDGGQSWSAPRLVAIVQEHSSGGNIRNGGALPSAEIDGAGRVYVTWSDCRFEPSCDANNIVLSTSSNGIIWSAPRRIPISPVGSGADAFTPGLGVDRATAGAHARLALVYYYYPQANCTVASCRLDVGFVSSTNGGRTWSRPTQLAGPMKVTWLAPTDSGYMAGDYMATTIVGNTAYPAIIVARHPANSLLHEAAYTMAEPVTGGPVRATVGPVLGRRPVTAGRAAVPAGTF